MPSNHARVSSLELHSESSMLTETPKHNSNGSNADGCDASGGDADRRERKVERQAKQPVKFVIVNRSPAKVCCKWVNPVTGGDSEVQVELPAGMQATLKTFANHAWRICSEDGSLTLATYECNDNETQSLVINDSMPAEPLRDPKKCGQCKRKIGLAAIRCRCGVKFCSRCIHAEDHGCTFDYLAEQRALLMQKLPECSSDKLADRI